MKLQDYYKYGQFSNLAYVTWCKDDKGKDIDNYSTPVCQAVYDWDITAEVPGLQESINATNERDAGAKVMSDHQVALQAFIDSQS